MKRLMKIIATIMAIVGALGFYSYLVYEIPRYYLVVFGLWYGGGIYLLGRYHGYKTREKDEERKRKELEE